jgi:hypothetical protein
MMSSRAAAARRLHLIRVGASDPARAILRQTASRESPDARRHNDIQHDVEPEARLATGLPAMSV